MQNYRKITDDTYYVGVNDYRLNLFENLFPIGSGVSYNSYVILDEKTAVLDGVDNNAAFDFLENVQGVIKGRDLDYIIVNHMEPDHSASLQLLCEHYKNAKFVMNAKTLVMFKQFYNLDISDRIIIITENDSLELGKHKLTFIFTPMVHWPESMMTYDNESKILFSADAFGSFGAIKGGLFDDEISLTSEKMEDIRRYYTNIVGKFGMPTQTALKKAAKLDIKTICPLHGIIWRENLGVILEKYDKWSKYEYEEKGVLIAYASMYGHTKIVAENLAKVLTEKGVKNVEVFDVSTTDVSFLISSAFKLSNIVLASVTYYNEIYPKMANFINDMKNLNLQNRTFSLIENGTWLPASAKKMREELKNLKNSIILDNEIKILSSMKEENYCEIETFAEEIVKTIR